MEEGTPPKRPKLNEEIQEGGNNSEDPYLELENGSEPESERGREDHAEDDAILEEELREAQAQLDEVRLADGPNHECRQHSNRISLV